MTDEMKEPWHDMVNYLRDNTIFARHSRAEVRDFLDRLDVDGYSLVAKVAAPVEIAPAEDEAASHD